MFLCSNFEKNFHPIWKYAVPQWVNRSLGVHTSVHVMYTGTCNSKVDLLLDFKDDHSLIPEQQVYLFQGWGTQSKGNNSQVKFLKGWRSSCIETLSDWKKERGGGGGNKHRQVTVAQNSAETYAQIIYVTYVFHIPTVLHHAVKRAVITCYTGMSITFQQENHYFGLPLDLVEFCVAHLAISKTQAEKLPINQVLDRKRSILHYLAKWGL